MLVTGVRYLPTHFLFLAVGGCEIPGRSRYDTTPKLLAIEDVRLAIPNNDIHVFDSEGRVERFTRASGVLLFLQWPTLTGRTPATIHDIMSTGGDNSQVADILLQTLGKKFPDPRDASASTYTLESTGDIEKTCDHTGCYKPDLKGSLERLWTRGSVTRYVRHNIKRRAFWDGPTADIFTRRNTNGELTGFVICERPYPSARSRIVSPGCSLYGRSGRLFFKSNFPQRTRLRFVWELERRIRAKLERYRRDAASETARPAR